MRNVCLISDFIHIKGLLSPCPLQVMEQVNMHTTINKPSILLYMYIHCNGDGPSGRKPGRAVWPTVAVCGVRKSLSVIVQGQRSIGPRAALTGSQLAAVDKASKLDGEGVRQEAELLVCLIEFRPMSHHVDGARTTKNWKGKKEQNGHGSKTVNTEKQNQHPSGNTKNYSCTTNSSTAVVLVVLYIIVLTYLPCTYKSCITLAVRILHTAVVAQLRNYSKAAPGLGSEDKNQKQMTAEELWSI